MLFEKGSFIRRLNKKLKIVHIPYRAYPKDFAEISANKAMDKVKSSLDEKN